MIGIWQLSSVERAAILLFAALFVEEKGKEGNFLNGFRLVKIERARKFLTDSTGNSRAGSSAWTGWIGFEGFETPWRSRILEQSRIKRFRALIFPRIRGLSERWMPPSNCDISGYRPSTACNDIDGRMEERWFEKDFECEIFKVIVFRWKSRLER